MLPKISAIFKPTTSATATVNSHTEPTVNMNTEEVDARVGTDALTADNSGSLTPSTSAAGTNTEDPDPPGQSSTES